MKKKVGIITYHKALNYGAALQCTSLINYLKANYNDIDFEIINYSNSINHNSNNSIKHKIRYLLLQRKRNKFKQFNRLLPLSKRYNTKNIGEIENEYDYFIIGSDQVWNYIINNDDKNYLLYKVNNKNKIFTYASSIGLSEIDDEHKKMFKKIISQYNMVSVREKMAQQIIGTLIKKEVELVLDPVFLIDRKEWLSLLIKGSKKNTILYYIFNKEFVGKADEMILNHNYKDNHVIEKYNGNIKIKDYLSKNVKVKINSSPLEFISSIFNSEIVFTDSFHCVAFSIIFHKNFVVFIDDNIMKTNSRMLNLLKISGLENRIYDKNNIEQLSESIDWNLVDERINIYKEKSKDYIEKMINKMR